MSCIKITPHDLEEGQVAIVPNKIIPLQEAKQYIIDIQKKEEKKEKEKEKNIKTMRILIENKLLKEGDKIYLKKKLPDYMEFEKDNPEFSATITGKLGQSN